MKWFKNMSDEAYWCIIMVVFMLVALVGHCVDKYFEYLKATQGVTN